MYNTSAAYKTAIAAMSRDWSVRAQIITSSDALSITASDIELNGVSYSELCFPGEKLTFGAALMSDVAISVLLSSELSSAVSQQRLNGARMTVDIGLKCGSPASYEWVPLGDFIIDTVERLYHVVRITAFDKMILTERPLTTVTLAFPCTAKQLLSDICGYCGIPGPSSFDNDDYMVTVPPDITLRCRDIIAAIAGLAGANARFTRTGILEFFRPTTPGFVEEADIDGNEDTADAGDFDVWTTPHRDGGVFAFQAADVSTDPGDRYSLKQDDTPVVVTGISYADPDGNILIAGTEKYAISVETNPLLTHDIEDIVAGWHEQYRGFVYLPCDCSFPGDPAIQAGDLVEHTDRSGTPRRTVVTSIRYRFRGKSQIDTKGTGEQKSDIRSGSAKQIAALQKKLAEKQATLDLLDSALQNAVSLISGVWGGFVVNGDELEDEQYAGNLFIADDKDPALMQKVWRWNIGGIGYSSTGIDGPYVPAITADGNIVADLITANMIRTGMLMSLNGKTYFNLNTGELAVKQVDENNESSTLKLEGTIVDDYAGCALKFEKDGALGGFLSFTAIDDFALVDGKNLRGIKLIPWAENLATDFAALQLGDPDTNTIQLQTQNVDIRLDDLSSFGSLGGCDGFNVIGNLGVINGTIRLHGGGEIKADGIYNRSGTKVVDL